MSLPSWERELKFYMVQQGFDDDESLPSWERELKFDIRDTCIHDRGRSLHGSVS